MLRILGILLVVTGFLGIGFLICESRENRISNLRDWRYALEIIVNEIRYKKQPVLFVIKECGKLLRGEVGEVFKQISGRYDNGEADIKEVWEMCIQDYLDRKITVIDDKKMIEGLYSVIGYDEEEMQLKMLKMRIEMFDKYISELEEEKKVKKKLTILLSSSSGIVLSLLLI